MITITRLGQSPGVLCARLVVDKTLSPVHGPPHGLPISVDYPKIDKPRASTVVRIKEDISPTSRQDYQIHNYPRLLKA